jgi:hypothetical protein
VPRASAEQSTEDGFSRRTQAARHTRSSSGARVHSPAGPNSVPIDTAVDCSAADFSGFSAPHSLRLASLPRGFRMPGAGSRRRSSAAAELRWEWSAFASLLGPG